MVVAREVPTQLLDASTPCSGWSVRDLLRHMAAQHRGFAASSQGRGATPGVWDERDAIDPVADYLAAAETVLHAFADPAVADRSFELPEIASGVPFPAATAISFHFIDYVVHGWDLARSVGRPYEPAADVVDAAMAVAERVPVGEARQVAGAAFAPVLENYAGERPFGRVLALLGRDPAWVSEVSVGVGKWSDNETDTPR